MCAAAEAIFRLSDLRHRWTPLHNGRAACNTGCFASQLTAPAPTTPCPPFQVENIIEMPQNDCLPLLEASRICNTDIIGRVQQVGEGQGLAWPVDGPAGYGAAAEAGQEECGGM